jgi:four helix bundle protein
VTLYKFTASFPHEEVYGLTSQLRRAGVSVASNITEGWGRQSDGEYKQFLGMARGSNLEVQTQLVIAAQLDFGEPQLLITCESLSNEVARMLVALMKSI